MEARRPTGEMGVQYGLPLKCPSCTPKNYFGVLKGEQTPKSQLKVGKGDTCPNCRHKLVPAR